jgi:hypothetical protein
MRISSKVYNTLPNPKSHWWQVVLFPTIAIMNNVEIHDPYVAINIEWLFWSHTIIINYGDQTEDPTAYFKG